MDVGADLGAGATLAGVIRFPLLAAAGASFTLAATMADRDRDEPGPSTALAVEAAGVRRVYNGVVALDGVDLKVERGTFFSLLGPSGCGKTTFLRVVAGLERPDAGMLRVEGLSAVEIPAHRRPVNTVFQSYALFPHLNVRENVAFGLRMKRVPAAERDRRVAEVMALVQIEALRDRSPSQLSGGQRQRVALARALVNAPKVLLLDEPLAALDVQLRQCIREELRDLQRRTGVTFILVTHDQDEALAVSDRIAVMRSGRVEQVGSGQELYERPRSRFVAGFLGACNVFDGEWAEEESGEFTIVTSFGRLVVGRRKEYTAPAPGTRGCVGIRPEHAEIWVDRGVGGAARENCFQGRVIGRTYGGAVTEWEIQLAGERLRVTRWNEAGGVTSIQPGNEVWVSLPREALMAMEA